MPAAEVLIAVHQNRPLIGNAGADAVGSFPLLRPDATQPNAPVLELVGVAVVPAVMDGDPSRLHNSTT